MAELPADRLVPPSPSGRTFRTERAARFGDVDRAAKVRLDALATYLQDIAGDDTAEPGLRDINAWIVRRNVFEVIKAPVFTERLTLTTWCSGVGRRWAERRLSIRGSQGAAVEGGSLWVYLDATTFAPEPLDARFVEVYGPATRGRTVSSRLQLPARPPEDGSPTRRPWVLRATDFDPYDHVNNAAAWGMVEEVLADHPVPAPLRAEVEHRRPIEAGADVHLVVQPDDGFSLWAVDGGGGSAPAGTVYLVARVRPGRLT